MPLASQITKARMQTHTRTHNIWYLLRHNWLNPCDLVKRTALLRFHCSSGYANASQYYVPSVLPVSLNKLLLLLSVPSVLHLMCSVQCSDSLRTGRSGDRIPVWARFSASVQNGPGAHPASYTMGTGSLSRGLSGRGVVLTTHPPPPPI
jgi:hypothetical protein